MALSGCIIVCWFKAIYCLHCHQSLRSINQSKSLFRYKFNNRSKLNVNFYWLLHSYYPQPSATNKARESIFITLSSQVPNNNVKRNLKEAKWNEIKLNRFIIMFPNVFSFRMWISLITVHFINYVNFEFGLDPVLVLSMIRHQNEWINCFFILFFTWYLHTHFV